MELKEFIVKFAEAIEIEEIDNLTGDTKFRDLPQWDSLAVMLFIAFFDEEFGKEISIAAIKECTTIKDLYNLAIA